MACLIFILTVLAVASSCLADNGNGDKCTLKEEDLKTVYECLEVVKPGTDPKDLELKPDNFSMEELMEMSVCHYKKIGAMNDDEEYFEDVLLDYIRQSLSYDESVKEVLIEGIVSCGTGKNHKTDGREILQCSSEVEAEVCSRM